MAKVAIVFFSGYGHTVKQAEAVEQGARSIAGAEVTVLRINEHGDLPESGFKLLAQQDAVIYGSPTYLRGPAWQFKKFADASSKLWGKQALKDTVAAGFTNSATVYGDTISTIQYLWTLSQKHSQVWVGLGQLPANKKASGPEDVNWTAGFTGALSISPLEASPDEAPHNGDLETAKLLGQRVAETAARLREG